MTKNNTTAEHAATTAIRNYLDTEEAQSVLSHIECVTDDLSSAISLIENDRESDPIFMLLEIEEFAQGIARDVRGLIEASYDTSGLREALADVVSAIVQRGETQVSAAIKAHADAVWASEKKLPKDLAANVATLGISANNFYRLSVAVDRAVIVAEASKREAA